MKHIIPFDRKACLSLAIVIVLGGCSKETDQDTQSDGRISEVYKDGVLWTKYRYNTEGSIAGVSSYDKEANLTSEVTYTYLEDTTFREDAYQRWWKYYPENDSTGIRENYTNGSYEGRKIYTFDAAGCGYSRLENYDDVGNLDSWLEAEILDENCSTRFTEYHADGTFKYKEEIVRDEFETYSSAAIIDFFQLKKAGNTIEKKVYDGNGLIIDEYTYTSTFEYDAKGKSKREVRTYNDGTVEEYLFYFYP